MPTSSGRKQAARERAARTGESYTRALRAIIADRSSTDGPAAAVDQAGVHDAQQGPDLDRIRAVQQLVEARGWVLEPVADGCVDQDGRVATTDVAWGYPAAFTVSAAVVDELRERLPDDLGADDPKGPECSVGWDDGIGLVIRVRTAGNWRGCRRHRTDEHTVPLGEATGLRLARLLTTVERAARQTDPVSLLDCTLDGPCAEPAWDRVARRARNLAWNHALVEAAKTFSVEQMAELQAWEDEHLGRADDPHDESIGTGDWPGWIPLIGAPPGPGPEPVLDESDPGPVPVPSPDNDSIPADLLRPVILGRADLPGEARALWTLLVSYYWGCEADRTVAQLRDHGADDPAVIDAALTVLTTADMITISDAEVVSINPDHLGVIVPPPT